MPTLNIVLKSRHRSCWPLLYYRKARRNSREAFLYTQNVRNNKVLFIIDLLCVGCSTNMLSHCPSQKFWEVTVTTFQIKKLRFRVVARLFNV